ncbi:hypothetical protein BMR86_25790, partial [Stenotrophomonas sp. KAs 5-3]
RLANYLAGVCRICSFYSSIRASAQGLFMTMVNGVGAWVGSILSGMAVDYFSVDGVKDWQTIWLVFAGYALFIPAFVPARRGSL